MRLSLVFLAVGCVLDAALAPWVVMALVPVLASVTKLSAGVVAAELAPVASLSLVVLGGFGLVVVVAGLVGLRWRLLAHRQVTEQVTWDCGYAQPTPRMQYTACLLCSTANECVSRAAADAGASLRCARDVSTECLADDRDRRCVPGVAVPTAVRGHEPPLRVPAVGPTRTCASLRLVYRCDPGRVVGVEIGMRLCR